MTSKILQRKLSNLVKGKFAAPSFVQGGSVDTKEWASIPPFDH
jgi:hypothetical protein